MANTGDKPYKYTGCDNDFINEFYIWEMTLGYNKLLKIFIQEMCFYCTSSQSSVSNQTRWDNDFPCKLSFPIKS